MAYGKPPRQLARDSGPGQSRASSLVARHSRQRHWRVQSTERCMEKAFGVSAVAQAAVEQELRDDRRNLQLPGEALNSVAVVWQQAPELGRQMRSPRKGSGMNIRRSTFTT